MKAKSLVVRTTLRLPGLWNTSAELALGLPDGYRLSGDWLVTPDGSKLQCTYQAADGQFANVFRTACRGRMLADEQRVVDGYRRNVCLTGVGGSRAAARQLLAAGSAIIEAGAAGVFIDNSALAHGASQWQEMAEDAGPDALSYAFVSVVHGQREAWTVGMHVLGLPDLLMSRSDADLDPEGLIDALRYLAETQAHLGPGHIIADEFGPRYRVQAKLADPSRRPSPMHNPLGRWKLTALPVVAEHN